MHNPNSSSFGLGIEAPELGLEGLITQSVGLGVLLAPVVEVEGRVGLLLHWVRQFGLARDLRTFFRMPN